MHLISVYEVLEAILGPLEQRQHDGFHPSTISPMIYAQILSLSSSLSLDI